MKKLYLIRHARQDDAKCNVNVVLSQAGLKQAELLGKRMKNYQIEKLYTSHLIRAIMTAKIINQHLNVPYEEVDGIEEIDFGEMTGKTDDEIKTNYAAFTKERNTWESDLPYPGGENGESVVKRAFPVMMKMLQGPEKSIAVVTHGGVIRSLLAYILEKELRYKLQFSKDLENCSITELWWDEENERFYLERLNDYAHIESYPELLRSGWNNIKL